MRPKKQDQGLVELPHDLDILRGAVDDEFSVTTRALCRALQCSRSFVGAHCRGLRHIYVSARWGDEVGVHGGGTLWSIPDLDRMVAGATVERRTRVMAFSNFTTDPDELAWAERAENRLEALEDGADTQAWLDLWGYCTERLKAVAGEAWAPAIDDRLERRRGRKETPWVDIGESAGAFADLGITWRTTAARRDYGDTDEEWSRVYWNGGARRLTLVLPDGAERVFYAADPHPAANISQFLALPLAIDLLPADYIRDVILAGSGDGEPMPLEIEDE